MFTRFSIIIYCSNWCFPHDWFPGICNLGWRNSRTYIYDFHGFYDKPKAWSSDTLSMSSQWMVLWGCGQIEQTLAGENQKLSATRQWVTWWQVMYMLVLTESLTSSLHRLEGIEKLIACLELCNCSTLYMKVYVSRV